MSFIPWTVRTAQERLCQSLCILSELQTERALGGAGGGEVVRRREVHSGANHSEPQDPSPSSFSKAVELSKGNSAAFYLSYQK